MSTQSDRLRDVRHRLAELVAEHHGWNGAVDCEAGKLLESLVDNSAPGIFARLEKKLRDGTIPQKSVGFAKILMQTIHDLTAMLDAEEKGQTS